MASNTTNPIIVVDASNHDELAIIARAPYPNALLIGSADRVRRWVADVLSSIQRPIVHCEGHVGAAIRGTSCGTTLVIWNMDQRGPDEQVLLLEAIERWRRDIQVISVAEGDLFERVRRGEFREDLYYRLNCVLIPTAPSPSQPGPRRRLAEPEPVNDSRGLDPPRLKTIQPFPRPQAGLSAARGESPSRGTPGSRPPADPADGTLGRART